MLSNRARKLLKYSLIGGALGSIALSLKGNQYEWDSIGIVRLTRAAITVSKIGVIYKRDLYGKGLDKKSLEYKELKVSPCDYSKSVLFASFCVVCMSSEVGREAPGAVLCK